jgi:hypothetical protein
MRYRLPVMSEVGQGGYSKATDCAAGTELKLLKPVTGVPGYWEGRDQDFGVPAGDRLPLINF